MNRKIFTTLTFFALIVLYSPSGMATPRELYTAEDLLHFCEGTANREERAVCFGYIDGFFTEYLRAAANPPLKLKDVCPPLDVDITQLRLVFLKSAEEHPSLLHLDAATFLHGAIQNAFPCR